MTGGPKSPGLSRVQGMRQAFLKLRCVRVRTFKCVLGQNTGMSGVCASCGKDLSKSVDPIVYRGGDNPLYVCSPGCGRALTVAESVDRLTDAIKTLENS